MRFGASSAWRALLVGVLISGVAHAESPRQGANVAPGKSAPTTTPVDDARTAYALARYGDAQKDPLALVVAARLLKDVGSSEAAATRVGSGPAETKLQGGRPMTAERIVERARALSAGRADLVALADDVAQGGTRGRSGGPGLVRDIVRRHATDSWRVVFRAGEPAQVVLAGDGDSDLDLYVHDQNQRLVCKSERRGDDEHCRWTPRWTGVFFVKVRNRGTANQYVLRTN